MKSNRISTAVYTHAGGREVNEDTAAVFQGEAGTLVIVADGLGGHGGGDVASQAAVESMKNSLLGMQSITKEEILNAFNNANAAVISRQRADCAMKTTVASVWFTADGGAIIAHAGDSRVYQLRNGEIIHQTADHSVPQMAVAMGEITIDDIRSHNERNIILRALGASTIIRPELFETELMPGDAFLVCSDGFWEPVLEHEMLSCLTGAESPDEWLDRMTAILGSRLNEESDNNTAVAVFINESGAVIAALMRRLFSRMDIRTAKSGRP